MNHRILKFLAAGLMASGIGAAGMLPATANDEGLGLDTPTNNEVVDADRHASRGAGSLTQFTLAPEWVAVRQQYEPSFQPVVVESTETESAQPPLGWTPVRQYYDPLYQPVVSGQPQPANAQPASDWLAVRQQYEPSFQPVVVQLPAADSSQPKQAAQLAPEWVAVRQQYDPSFGV